MTTKKNPHLTPWGLLLWSFTSAPWRLVSLAITLLLVWGCEIAIPWMLGETVDAAVRKSGASTIMHLGLLMLAVTGVLYVVHNAYLRVEAVLVARAEYRLRQHIYTRLIAQPLSFFSKQKGGEIGHRIMGDTEVIQKHAIYLLTDVPFAILTVSGVVAVMLWSHVGMGLLVVAVLSAAAALSHYVGRPLVGIEKSINALYARMGGRLQEVITGIRTVKTFGRARYEIEQLDQTAAEKVAAEIVAGKVAAKLEPLLELIEAFGLVAVVWYGAYLVFEDVLTPGRLVAFIAYMELMSEPLQRAGRYYRQYQQAKGTLTRIAELLTTMPPPLERTGRWVDGPLAVSIEDLSFTHAGASKPGVDHVSLEAMPGEIIAVVGPNGAGKSTLMDLLLGFQKAQSGTIRVGGLALEEWDEAAWRGATAVVTQEVFLFHMSLADNIRYGRLDASGEQVAAAAAQAGLGPLLSRLPQGIDTIVGDRGTKLSGGERQRVALARLLIRSPRVLIFDEPNSALDGAAVRDLGSVMRDSAPGRVTFVIAHRRETVSVADRIAVMDHGRIVAMGTIAELEADSHLFRRLFKVAA